MIGKISDRLIRAELKAFTKERNGFEALEECINNGFEPLYAYSIVLERLDYRDNIGLWDNIYCTPGVAISTKTKKGKEIVIFDHTPSSLCDFDYIRHAFEDKGICGGGVIIPKQEIREILERVDNKNIFVVDFNKLFNADYGCLSLKKALNHPQLMPHLGGVSKEQAQEYLELFTKRFGGVFEINGIYDEPIEGVGMARYLSFGNKRNISRGIDADTDILDFACFLGAKPELANNIAEQNPLERKILNSVRLGKRFSFKETEYIPFERQRSADEILERNKSNL